MTPRTPSVADEIERYLRTGDSDPYHAAWSGRSFLEKAQLAHADLENALVAEVSRRANGWQPPSGLVGSEDLAAFTRARVEPILERCSPPKRRRPDAPVLTATKPDQTDEPNRDMEIDRDKVRAETRDETRGGLASS